MFCSEVIESLCLRESPNNAPAPNRRPRFPLATMFASDYDFCAPPSLSAAVGEPRRSGTRV
jgi:hypothetical protein